MLLKEFVKKEDVVEIIKYFAKKYPKELLNIDDIYLPKELIRKKVKMELLEESKR